jgi:hypothetical protein
MQLAEDPGPVGLRPRGARPGERPGRAPQGNVRDARPRGTSGTRAPGERPGRAPQGSVRTRASGERPGRAPQENVRDARPRGTSGCGRRGGRREMAAFRSEILHVRPPVAAEREASHPCRALVHVVPLRIAGRVVQAGCISPATRPRPRWISAHRGPPSWPNPPADATPWESARAAGGCRARRRGPPPGARRPNVAALHAVGRRHPAHAAGGTTRRTELEALVEDHRRLEPAVADEQRVRARVWQPLAHRRSVIGRR